MRLIAALAIALAPLPLGAASIQASNTSLSEGTRQGLALRARYGIAAPAGIVTISIDSIAVHHISEEYSLIAWRDAAGVWTMSSVSEDGPGLLSIPRTIIPETRRLLSPAESRTLDRLIGMPGLYRELPPKPPRDIGVGAPFHSMEIATPRRHLVLPWMGRLKGKAGQIADLLMGRG